MADGYIVEAFSSLQGEGAFLGARHIFIRLAGCSIACDFCDTDHAPPDTVTVNGVTFPNPVDADTLACLIAETFDLSAHHMISFTGGEPLEQADFLVEAAVMLKEKGARLLLETGGYYPETLAETDGLFHSYSIDIKPASMTKPQNVPGMLEAAARLSETAHVALKYLLAPEEEAGRAERIASMVKDAGLGEVYVQPLHGDSFDIPAITAALAAFQLRGIDAFFRPQFHKIIDIP